MEIDFMVCKKVQGISLKFCYAEGVEKGEWTGKKTLTLKAMLH